MSQSGRRPAAAANVHKLSPSVTNSPLLVASLLLFTRLLCSRFELQQNTKGIEDEATITSLLLLLLFI